MKDFKEPSGKNPFKVPEDYFEKVNERILAETTGKSRASMKVVHRKQWRIPAIAAAVTGFIILGFGAARFFLPGKSSSLDGIINESNIEMIINDLDVNLLEANSIPYEANGFSSGEIIDFLLQENIDINEIEKL